MANMSMRPSMMPGGRSQRSVKNFIIDRKFQLKYTSILVGVAVVLSAVVGPVLWSTSAKLAEQSARAVQQAGETVKQSRETIERGKQVVIQRQRAGDVLLMYMVEQYREDDDVAKSFLASDAKDAKALAAEQERLEREAVALAQRARDIEEQSRQIGVNQQRLMLVLIAALTLMTLIIGAAGIVVTHKVAGPIFKMKRLLGDIGAGKLVFRDQLRKGDELQHFFGALTRMSDGLRAGKLAEIAQVDRAIEKLGGKGEAADVEAGIEVLTDLRERMKKSIEV